MTAPLPFDPIAEARTAWEYHWGTTPAPSMAAVTSIMRAQQILMTRLNDLLRPLELTFPRYEALMLLYLSRTGSLPIGKIGERLQVHPTSVTNTIDGLERLRLVRREPSPHDRRRTLATLTTKGRSTAEQATTVLNNAKFGTAPLRRQQLETISSLIHPLRAAADSLGSSRD